jgi:signal transduction histidine kinase
MTKADTLAAAGLAHDLNNVLQTLVGVASDLDHDPDLAGAILRSVDRVRQILAGLGNGAHTSPLEEIVEHAVAFLEDFRLAAKAPVVSVVTTLDDGIVLSGQWAWERVLINLFLNSLRAMPDGGTIYITARHTDSGCEISVADDGPGIAPDLLDHLFQPHVSGNGSTGLGLNIVESIVHANGGTIHARNGARGAEFSIAVPALVRSARA